MGLVPLKLSNVQFLAQIVPSRVTRARIFAREPRKKTNKQTNKMASEITSVQDEYIPFLSSFPPLNLTHDLQDNHLDNNSEYEVWM